MARTNNYWDKRFEDLNEQLLNEADNHIPYMEKEYKKAISNIQKEINHFYAQFATNNEISYLQAKKMLTHGELETFKMSIEEYIEKGEQLGVSKEWLLELKNASVAHRVSRLKALQIQMRQQVEALEGAKEQGFNQVLSHIYSEGYYKSIYTIQKAFNVGSAFSTLDNEKIYKVLSKPWQPDGSNFSERIWGADRTKVVTQLETNLTQAIIRGANPMTIAAGVAKTLGVSKRNTERLLLTESAFFASASRKDVYKELGVKRYKVLATLDSKTSDICQEMDLKVFAFSEYNVEVTAPPFHPRCRTTTVPLFDDEFTKDSTRAARDSNEKSIRVPANMTYKEWKEKYVDEAS